MRALPHKVESRTGAMSEASTSRSRFPSPLIKPDVLVSSIRLSDRLHQLAHGGRFTRHIQKTQHAQFPEEDMIRKSGGASRRHLMTPSQEMPHALVNVMIDCTIRDVARAATEIV